MYKLILGLTSALYLVSWVIWEPDLKPINQMIADNVEYNNTQFINDILIHPANTTCRDRPFITVIVTSYVGNVVLRNAHRRAMPKRLLNYLNVSRVFLLAKIPPEEKYITQNVINDESRMHGDVLQGSFVENYHNLTHKHLMGLQWASTNCSGASYILKVDDDTVFSLERTYALLKSIRLDGDFFMGYMLNNSDPVRSNDSKWYVSFKEYPGDKYPVYLSGGYYITTPNTAKRVIEMAKDYPYFRIDDLLVTGLLAEALNITHVQVPNGFWLKDYELLECCLKEMIKNKIMCDAAVGPNGERTHLILIFNEVLKMCWKYKKCVKRPKNQTLEKVCAPYYKTSLWSPQSLGY